MPADTNSIHVGATQITAGIYSKYESEKNNKVFKEIGAGFCISIRFIFGDSTVYSSSTRCQMILIYPCKLNTSHCL